MNYIFKLFVSFILEILIHILYVFNLLVKAILLFTSTKEKLIRENTNIELLIFKSGTMGDHLICIDCIDKILKIDNKINSKIVCKSTSIFKDLSDFASQHNVELLPYNLLINYFLKNFFNEKIIFIIDTEPNFRLGILFGLLMPRSIISSNYRTPFDLLFKKFHSYIKFNHYDENLQEGLYIIKLINNCINLNFYKSNLNSKLQLINKFDFKNKFLLLKNSDMNFKNLLYHDEFIDNIDLKGRRVIYLYYGCSGKAIHRLPPEKWFKKLEILLLEKYFICYVGGPSELGLKKILSKNKFTSFNLINKFSITDWSIILNNSKYKIPLFAFDGGFSHIFGIHSPIIFQVFCSSNNKKWRNKSDISFTYSCLEGGSPNYKPFKFMVPEKCFISQNAWINTNQNDVFESFNKWFNTIPKYKNSV